MKSDASYYRLVFRYHILGLWSNEIMATKTYQGVLKLLALTHSFCATFKLVNILPMKILNNEKKTFKMKPLQ